MKKSFLSIIFFLLPTLLCACGNTSEVKIIEVKSDIYTEDDINAAISIVLSDFKNNFDDCELHRIQYVGDKYKDKFIEWQNKYNMDEVIILKMDFYSEKYGQGSLNPDCEYTDWGCILARNKGEDWVYKDGGFLW